jgi:hypothetical protein
MRPAVIRRSLAAAAAVMLLTVPSVFAETVDLDTDLLTTGNQNVIDLGTVPAGSDQTVDVYFVLTCSGTSHVDSTQAVRVVPATRIIPSGGGYSVGTLTFGLGSAWPADGEPCPTDLPPTIGGPMHVVVTAPDAPGLDYRYVFTWSRNLVPTTTTDAGTFAGSNPQITISLDVAEPTVNTPPELQLPADSTVEGNATGGAVAAYTVTATDAEDAVAPTPSCSPATGSLLPLGTNTISCSASDSAGLGASGSFHITVVDTTDPVLQGMPGDVTLTTNDPGGAALTYTPPTATDVVDDTPNVQCSPVSGSTIPVGDTTVTCTATDASGNTASASFAAHVTLVETPPPSDPQARWDDPVGATAGIVVNGSRSVPVKVWLTLDGTTIQSGHGLLTVASCDGGAAVQTDPLDVQSSGRWMGHVDTGGLTPGCYQVVAGVDGQPFGSFQLAVRGATAPTATPVVSHGASHLKQLSSHHRTPFAKHSKGRGKP